MIQTPASVLNPSVTLAMLISLLEPHFPKPETMSSWVIFPSSKWGKSILRFPVYCKNPVNGDYCNGSHSKF